MYQRFQDRLVTVDRANKSPIKNCPWCKVRIEKVSGCNKMTCRCGQSFCWICGSRISGYDHFSQGGNCNLFNPLTKPPPPDIRNVNFHDGYVAYRAALLNNNAQESKCPRCRNKNVKTGRLNFIKCWFCKGHFCFHCGENLTRVKNASSHYSAASNCKQHSD